MPKGRTYKYHAQVECERLMASDYYDCCMCGRNGDHNLLSEEDVERIWDEEYGV